jgi:hypothetical protein
MSSPLAIAAVTAALKDLLNDGLLNHDLSGIGSFTVTAQPPDRITTGTTENNQLNVFLYQVTPNLGWRNADLPSRDGNWGRLSNPPLALDLHYLLSAYGAQDMNAEVLLGYAMHLLHENPVLSRQQLRTVLGAPFAVDGTILPGPFGALSALDLADQVELIKIVPVFLSAEDLSKLWTAMQARYRPSMAYMVSVVLIQSSGGAKIAPPVLARGADDRGPISHATPAPTLNSVRPALSPHLPAARLGDDLLVSGAIANRGGTITAQFDNLRLGITLQLPLTAGASASQLSTHLPSVDEDAQAMTDWGVGVYTVSARIAEPNLPAFLTNGVPLALAPRITVNPLNAIPGTVSLSVTCEPRLRQAQEAGARLLFGSGEVLPTSITTPADPTEPTTLEFTIDDVGADDYLVRLRVDGIDSLPVELVGAPPRFAFDALQTVVVK